MRTFALAIVAALTPACFYTEVINVAPTAEIERLDTATTVTTSTRIRVSARRSQDPDGDALTYEWRARTCAGCAVAAASAMEFEYTVSGHDDVNVTLTVRDEHGAAAVASLGFVVSNQQPDVAITRQGTANDDGTFTAGRELFFYAQATDPDADAIQSYSFELHPPPGASAWAFGSHMDDPQTYRLVPDVPGMWEVVVVARDDLGAAGRATLTVQISEDQPPHIAATVPEWSPDARVILLRSAGPRRFVVASVTDDLDPYPGSDQAGFRWWVRLPGAALVEVPGHDLAELIIDPTEFDPGDELEVRVEISDRLPRTLPCAPAQAACSLTSDARYQRLTWTAEVR